MKNLSGDTKLAPEVTELVEKLMLTTAVNKFPVCSIYDS